MIAAVTRRPELMLLGSALLFSTGGAAIKLCSLSAMHVGALRAAIAASLLFLFVPESRRLRRSTLLLVLPYVGSTLLYVWANKMTTAANAIFLQATYPLWVMLLGTPLLGEKPRPRDFAVLACIAAGMWLCISETVQTATAPEPGFGNMVALASGLSFGLMIGFRWLGRRGGSEQPSVVAWGNTATVLIAGSLAGALPHGGTVDWLVILYLGVFQVACGYLLLMRGTAHVPALQASLLMMAEPAFNPVWAFLVHGEDPGRNTILGGVLIVGAVALGNLRRSTVSEASPSRG